ncbi:response regulator transcription factor [Paraburkholderia unamae]|uniref:response regulator transcription factor n=1 Tax=Paraburkholderia unamae TaxID=219649 RepID=UPI001CC55A08|nr:response regulator transcription factor [Paraburkholderia unamae]
MRIAVLADSPAQTEFVCRTLTAAGHACHVFTKGDQLARNLRRQTFDLLVADLNVPELSGDKRLHRVRRSLSTCMPVLFMTSSTRQTDIAQMLRAGMDGYVEKPLSAPVLIARVNSLLRCANKLHSPALKETFGAYEFDQVSRQVSVYGRQVALTQKEYDLALLLFQQLSRPLSRAHILDVIWKQSGHIPSRTLDTHVSVLRAKLGLQPESGYHLTSIYGYGYRLERIAGRDA